MTEDDVIAATEWPTHALLVTADALILHSARLAMAWQAKSDVLMHAAHVLDRESPEYRPAMRVYVDAVEMFIHEAQVAELLVAVQAKDAEFADALALRIWELTEDGGVLSERLWEHLDDRGIDADEVWRLSEESAAGRTEQEGASDGRDA